jgi:hypothetical protein
MPGPMIAFSIVRICQKTATHSSKRSVESGNGITQTYIWTNWRACQPLSLRVGETVDIAEARLGFTHGSVAGSRGPRTGLPIPAHTSKNERWVVRVQIGGAERPSLESCNWMFRNSKRVKRYGSHPLPGLKFSRMTSLLMASCFTRL